MPYIKPSRREELEAYTEADIEIYTPGELNYLVTCLMLDYMFHHGFSYDTLNAIRGALENAQSEFYRRVVVPYEREKCGENGDVYPFPEGSEFQIELL